MAFIPISIDKYVEKHLKNDPSEKEKDLRNRLNSALMAYKNGEKCACGIDIWVIGSASGGNGCFTCITGESYPTDDYEIDSAVKKNENKKSYKNIDKMDKSQIHGFFDDNGYEINTELIKKPGLCLICINDDNQNEEMLCHMTRYDQKDEKEFKCFAYKKR